MYFYTVPPESIQLKEEMKNYSELVPTRFYITTCSCKVVSAYPPCNISWDHSMSLLGENIEESGNVIDGFNTTSTITLNVSTTTEFGKVTCYAHCGDYMKSETLQLSWRSFIDSTGGYTAIGQCMPRTVII